MGTTTAITTSKDRVVHRRQNLLKFVSKPTKPQGFTLIAEPKEEQHNNPLHYLEIQLHRVHNVGYSNRFTVLSRLTVHSLQRTTRWSLPILILLMLAFPF